MTQSECKTVTYPFSLLPPERGERRRKPASLVKNVVGEIGGVGPMQQLEQLLIEYV